MESENICPKCGSSMSYEMMYLGKNSKLELDICIKDDEVKIKGWKEKQRAKYQCSECKTYFS